MKNKPSPAQHSAAEDALCDQDSDCAICGGQCIFWERFHPGEPLPCGRPAPPPDNTIVNNDQPPPCQGCW